MAKATFAAGCIWGVEAAFQCLHGVLGTRVGYTESRPDHSSADVGTLVCGHVKAVEVRFDPAATSYAELLEVFWQSHDPSETHHQQDRPGQMARSMIFYHDSDQRNEALAAKIMLERSGRFKDGIATAILPALPIRAGASVKSPAVRDE